mmetsp:Transcript_65147/g.121436  ORF Transcript_65147/g.121436 Transcript_65147/m.121436 type:complete len:387 (-) Transcript_65147:43-1203(-)
MEGSAGSPEGGSAAPGGAARSEKMTGPGGMPSVEEHTLSFYSDPNTAAAFMPPDHVKRLLRPEDWEALTKVWAQVEEETLRMVEEDWDDAELQEVRALRAKKATSQSPGKEKRKQQPWNQEFHLMGMDHRRRPARLRRYFDPANNGHTPWCPIPEEIQENRLKSTLLGKADTSKEPYLHTAHSVPWSDAFHHTVDVDNDKLHPMLRHYFDCRGLEASFRTRPHVSKSDWRTKVRTPRRPPTRDRILKWSVSEPSLLSSSSVRTKEEICPQSLDTDARHTGSITWGRRCLQYGRPGSQPRIQGPPGTIPWVHDHHVSVSFDNDILNPRLRHYFKEEGLEASFRNRGHHYGRNAFRPDAFYGPCAVDERSRLQQYGRTPDFRPDMNIL